MRTPSVVLSLLLFTGCRTSSKLDTSASQLDTTDSATGTLDADGDGYSSTDDCDDANADVNPEAIESCDGIDNDCDGQIDEADAEDAAVWYADRDGDGFGDASAQTSGCDAPEDHVAESAEGFDCDDADPAFYPGAPETDCTDPSDYNCDGSVAYEDADADGWAACEDCNDADAAVHPAATETCNEIDDDCDTLIDDSDDSLDLGTATSWYRDADEDGFGDLIDNERTCTAPSGYVAEDPAGFDCDDMDPRFYPGAPEEDCADPSDYNCDGSVAYEDADADGWAACEECNDADAAVNPDATELCNGVDDDCNGLTDDDDAGLDSTTATTWYADTDADGYGDAASTTLLCDAPSGYVADDTDCDDTSAAVNPAATEVCNAIDDDCNGSIDDDDAGLDSTTATTWYADTDADGYGDAASTVLLCDMPSGYVADDTDCDDTSAGVSPAATETCNGIDDDCDALIDDDDSSVDLTTGSTWYADTDADGYGDPASTALLCDMPSGYTTDSTDCDDTSAAVNPAATEVCNTIDDDCDSLIDDDDTSIDLSTGSTWYADTDADGYGDAAVSQLLCAAPSGYVADDTDCDDSNTAVNPAATEVCNTIDDDCNSLIDDADPGVDMTTATEWFIDTDADGYGESSSTTLLCDMPSGYAATDTDCDDTTPTIYPGADEYCDGIDSDCDGVLDEDDAVDALVWYLDVDGDGFGNIANTTQACSQPSGYESDATDCDDGDATINPVASETCDGADNDCDGSTDESDAIDAATWYIDSDGDGYGTTSSSTPACTQPSGYANSSTDCDDGSAAINPGATEVCANATDEDCDGAYSEGCSSTYVSCGGPGAMDPGQSHSCSIGSSVWVDTIYISVGCNDGETGSYTIYFDDGSSETVRGSCRSTHSITPRLTNNMRIYMNSGGGGDNHISFTCCGSGGWGAYYR